MQCKCIFLVRVHELISACVVHARVHVLDLSTSTMVEATHVCAVCDAASEHLLHTLQSHVARHVNLSSIASASAVVDRGDARIGVTEGARFSVELCRIAGSGASRIAEWIQCGARCASAGQVVRVDLISPVSSMRVLLRLRLSAPCPSSSSPLACELLHCCTARSGMFAPSRKVRSIACILSGQEDVGRYLCGAPAMFSRGERSSTGCGRGGRS